MTFYLENMSTEHLQLCAENYLFLRVRFEKHLISVLKTHTTCLLTQLLIGAMLGSSQPLILKEASIFSWLPQFPAHLTANCHLDALSFTPSSHTLYIIK